MINQHGEPCAEIIFVRSAKQIEDSRQVLTELRERVGQSDDMLTSPDWFTSRTLMWDATPVIVLQRLDGIVQSAVLLHVRCWHGISTGVLKCGNLTGDGGVVAPAAERARVLQQAMTLLLSHRFVHTVIATFRQPGGSLAIPTTRAVHWQPREMRCRLDLSGGLDSFLMRQSRKFRRNFRYYRRRAEVELGCRFVPELTAAQSVAAVRALHGQGTHPVPTRRALMHEQALRSTPGAFAMGLLDQDGQWLSYLAGWRQGDTTSVEWQLNLVDPETTSFSTVMRSFFLEHEATNGVQSVQFVGGTARSWARACEPETCYDILATRTDPIGRSVTALLAWLRPNGQMGLLHQQRGLNLQ